MPGRRGSTDPLRKERIISAAETVVLTAGAAALTHRAVAEQAGVPLGSTTYYFATLSELRQAVLHRLLANYRDWLHGWAERVGRPAPAKLATALTDLVCEGLGEYRQHIIAEYELSVAAMRDPTVAEAASGYSDITIAVLSRMTTKPTAAALSAALDGLHLKALAGRETPARREIASVFKAILLPSPNRPSS